MQEGAFALIDCLGWKGIWNKRDKEGNPISPRQILDKVRAIEEHAVRRTRTIVSAYKMEPLRTTFRPKISFLSDTIAISIPTVGKRNRLNDSSGKGLSVQLLCMMVANIVDYFVEQEPYLTMRGCITFGEHLIQRANLLGPAVDEAASLYELPLGAFVWLEPKAAALSDLVQQQKETDLATVRQDVRLQPFHADDQQRVIAFFEKTMGGTPFIVRDYPMPIHGGGNLVCQVVNPLCVVTESDQRAFTIERYMSTFDRDSIDVLIKKQNTMDFLAVAANEALDYVENADFELLEKTFGPIRDKIRSANDFCREAGEIEGC